MIISTSQGDVVIQTQPSETKLGIQLSGGADSSLLLYILTQYKKNYRPEVSIVPMTVQGADRNYQLNFSTRVISIVQDLTGVEISTPVVTEPVPGQLITTTREITIRSSLLNGVFDCCFSGITKNPPKFLCEKWEAENSAAVPDPTRFEENKTTRFDTVCSNGKRFNSYRPFANHNKQAIAEIYNQFGLMDCLFPYTMSCTKPSTLNDLHCEDLCFWCKERKWGFGRIE